MDKAAALVVNTLENSMVDNIADSLVVRPEGRTVKPLKGHCPNCNGDLGWRPIRRYRIGGSVTGTTSAIASIPSNLKASYS